MKCVKNGAEVQQKYRKKSTKHAPRVQQKCNRISAEAKLESTGELAS
jgi:hypothetical protein